MSDRPKRLGQQKDKTKEKDSKDEPVDKNTPQKSTQQSIMLPTPESKTSTEESRNIQAGSEVAGQSNNEQEVTTRLVKRKGIDDDYLAIMENKYKTLKLLTDAAGSHEDVGTPRGREYTYRISKLSNAINCDSSTAIDLKDVIDEQFE
jgi:hypothetical protein